MLKKFNVFYTFIQIKDATGLFLSETESHISVFRITSKYEKKSAYIKLQYYEIEGWESAGLKQKSWIDVGTEIILDKTELGNMTIWGSLATKDIVGMDNFIKTLAHRRKNFSS